MSVIMSFCGSDWLTSDISVFPQTLDLMFFHPRVKEAFFLFPRRSSLHINYSDVQLISDIFCNQSYNYHINIDSVLTAGLKTYVLRHKIPLFADRQLQVCIAVKCENSLINSANTQLKQQEEKHFFNRRADSKDLHDIPSSHKVPSFLFLSVSGI